MVEKEKQEEKKSCNCLGIRLNTDLFQLCKERREDENENDEDDENDEIEYILFDKEHSIHMINSYVSFEQECTYWWCIMYQFY